MGRVFITGDTHYKEEYQKVERLCEKAQTTKDDILIILGDHGCLYYGGRRDMRMRKYLESLPISFMIIKGNHDQRPSESIFTLTYVDRPEVKGTFYIDPQCPSLMFTTVYGEYEIIGKKAYVMGGAYSIDKWYRLEQYSLGFHNYRWFYDEQMSESEMMSAYSAMEIESFRCNRPYDFILTHTCPISYEPFDKFIGGIDQSEVDKTMERFFDRVEKNIPYNAWYCGHYHVDRKVDKVRLMYNDILELE